MKQVLNRILVELIRVPFMLLWRLMGWRTESHLPDIDKFVIIGVPHTTNWDYFHMLAFATLERRRPHVTIKDSYMKPPFGWFIRALGGIGIDRSKSNNMVDAMASMFDGKDRFLLVFTPEATRGYLPYWKTGFYYTAQAADVPVVCGYIDYERKVVGAGLVLEPSGNVEADFEKIRQFYDTTGVGKFPENVNKIAIRPRTEETQPVPVDVLRLENEDNTSAEAVV